MNEFVLFAFVIAPLTLLALGWGAVLAHEWALRRTRNKATR